MRERIGLLDAYPAHAKASGHRGEIGRAKADQLLSPARPIAGDPPHPGQVLAKVGIVVDDDSHRYAAAAGRLQFREVVIEPAIARKTQDLASGRRTFGA